MRTFIIFSVILAAWDIIPAKGLMTEAPVIFRVVCGVIFAGGIVMAFVQDIREIIRD